MAGRGLPLKTDTAVSQIPMATGAGQAFQVQASMFGRIADVATAVGADFAKKAQEDAARDAQKDFVAKSKTTPEGTPVAVPERRGLFGWEDRTSKAYNNMIEALTLDRTKKDVAKAAAEQRAKNYGDVEGFRKAMSGWTSGYMKSAPLETATEIELTLQDAISTGEQAVLDDRIQADIKEAREEMDAGIEALMSETETLLREGIGAMNSETVQQKSAELRDRLDIKAKNPLYGYSDGQRELDSAAMADRLMVASLVPEVRKVFDENGFPDALDAADQLALGLGRDEAATSNIRQRLRQEVNLMNQNLNARQEAEREKERAQAAKDKVTGTALDQQATRTIYNPSATMEQRIAAVNAAAPYVTGDRYSSLYRLAVKGPSGDDDDGGQGFARLMYLARKGQLSEDEAFEQGSALGLSGSKLNQVMEEVERRQSTDLKAGNEIISGAFARSQFSTDFGPLAAAEAEAKEDLRRWREQNPEATVNEVTNAAREISVKRGRASAVSMLSEINAKSGDFDAPTIPAIDARLETLEDQLADTPAGTSAEAEITRKYQQLQEVKRLLELGNGP